MKGPRMSQLHWRIGLAAILAVSFTGCAPSLDRKTLIPGREPFRALHRVAQLGQGGASHFGICLEPACPQVNAKSPPRPVPEIAP